VDARDSISPHHVRGRSSHILASVDARDTDHRDPPPTRKEDEEKKVAAAVASSDARRDALARDTARAPDEFA